MRFFILFLFLMGLAIGVIQTIYTLSDQQICLVSGCEIEPWDVHDSEHALRLPNKANGSNTARLIHSCDFFKTHIPNIFIVPTKSYFFSSFSIKTVSSEIVPIIPLFIYIRVLLI